MKKPSLRRVGSWLLLLCCGACAGGRSSTWQEDTELDPASGANGSFVPREDPPASSGGVKGTTTLIQTNRGGAALGSGGAPNLGGNATGGRSSTGGNANTGGGKSTGGSVNKGGSTNAAGSTGKAGAPGMGGLASSGGRATGGAMAASGASGFAGSSGLAGAFAGHAGSTFAAAGHGTSGGNLATAGTAGAAGNASVVGNDWYVDAQSGLDIWPGTSTQPFKSLARAAVAAMAHDTVYLFDGTWDPTIDKQLIGLDSDVCGGDTGIAFAPNVRLRAKNPGAARIVAGGFHGLCMSGGSIEGIRFDCAPGRPVIEIRRGTLEIVGSTLRNCSSPGLDMAGTAQVALRPSGITDYSEADNGSFVIAREQSSLTIWGGKLSYMSNAIRLEDAASLAVHGVAFGPSSGISMASYAISWEQGNHHVVVDGGTTFDKATMALSGVSSSFDVTIDDVAVTNSINGIDLYQNDVGATASLSIHRLTVTNCNGYGIGLSNDGRVATTVTESALVNLGGPAIMVNGSGSVVLESISVAGGWGGFLFQRFDEGTGLDVKVRSASITNTDWVGVRIIGHALDHYDLGTVTSPGNNTFRGNNAGSNADTANLAFCVPANVTIQAVGNTWDPNEQGADASGHYIVVHTSNTAPIEVTGGSGKNYVSTAGNAGSLRLAEIP